MTLQLGDIVSYGFPPPGEPGDYGRPPAFADPDPGLTRRGVLRTVAVAGMTLGLMSLGVFRPARQALAHHATDGDTIFGDPAAGPCAPGEYASDECETGLICGPSDVCETCCNNFDPNHIGLHRYDANEAGGYSWRPNECWDGVYDGWYWACDGITYNCHDGYLTSTTGTTPTICKWPV